MAKGGPKKKSDPLKQRPDETWLQWRSRLATQRDMEEASKQPLVSQEAAKHGKYEDGWTELEGRRAAVKINRGGSTINRWLNQPPCDILGDSERAAIRYCQMLWARLDYRSPAIVVVDFGRDGMTEHEALAELAAFKTKLPRQYWDRFENICRFELAATDRRSKVMVGFVAGMIAMWRGL